MEHSDERGTGGTDGRTDRQDCYEAILGCPATRAEEAYDPICQAWRRCMRAEVAGLWLYNRFSRTFELNGLAASGSTDLFSDAPKLTAEGGLYYVRETRAPEFIADVATWTRERDGKRYHVVTRDWLLRKGWGCGILVPILNPTAGGAASSERDEPVEGVVSLHFADHAAHTWCRPRTSPAEGELDERTKRSLLLLGRMSGLLVAKLRLRQQAEIGDTLARIAGRHLTRVRDDPRVVRREFVQEVLERILRDELRIQAASFWCRVPFSGTLTCVATLGGLARISDGRVLYTSSDIADAEYHADERLGPEGDPSWTYEAFHTGRYRLWRPDDDRPHTPKYRDLVNATPQDASPILLMPILPASHDPATESSTAQALGVVRCAHLPAPKFGEAARRTFDVVEVRILDYVCRQLSPVLHTLETRILREDAISAIKHDTAASLGTIRDMIDELERKLPAREEGVDYSLRNIRENAMSAASLTDRLARDVEHRLRIEPSKVDVGREIMPRVKRLLTPYAKEEKGMDIRFDGFDALPPLNVDPRLVERALYNLIVNAVKYGKPESTIRIDASARPDGYAIDVSNYGDGIRDEDIPRLFRMYFRSRYARGEGSGLGLAIVRQIMRSHQGEATLVSPRNPATFRLLFPATRAALSR
ncbi:MAG: HAMP domain-containing sensor histidine kinase [Phycisphaerales bacterium]